MYSTNRKITTGRGLAETPAVGRRGESGGVANMTSKKWMLLLILVSTVIMLVLVFTVGEPYPQTRPAITVLINLYAPVVLIIFSIYRKRKERKK